MSRQLQAVCRARYCLEHEVLVIDEFSGIRKAIVNKSEQEHFFDAIAKCKQLIVADAFLSDADIALIRKLRTGPMALYRQKLQKSLVKINWIETRTKQGEISFNHNGAYFDLLQSWVSSGFSRIAIAVDSIKYAKAIQQFLEGCTFMNGRKPRVWLACSETVEENSIFMLSPDQTIEQNQIDIVIYSPTAKSGLDIQSGFDCGLLICCGVLPPTEMLQMLGRCRQCREWWVSAPRQSSNPGCITPSLNGQRVQQWADQVSQTFDEFGFNAPSHLQGWGVWEALTKDIEKAFGSEYIHSLLMEYFESVETIEVSSDSVVRWRKEIDQIVRQDAENTLKADLEKGLQLIEDQKQPANNAQVWDVKLAQFWLKYPKLAKKSAFAFQTADQETQCLAKQRELAGGEQAISNRFSQQCREIDRLKLELELTEETIDVQRRIRAEEQSEEAELMIRNLRIKQQELRTQIEQLENTAFDQNLNLKLIWANEQREGAIDLYRTMTSHRVEKIKNWVTAIDQDPENDRDLIRYLRERHVNYSSGAFKTVQNLTLFRALHLSRLAKYRGGKVAAESADTTHFNARSPIIIQLYAEFDANPTLRKLFPMIATIEKFWQQIRSCLGALGYQSQGNKIRVKTEELHPNGKDRNGKQRFTDSKPVHFIAWLVMECSGSAFFQENFELIIESIRDRLAAERLERQQWRASHTAPPPTAEAA
ncbi:MAG: hypothetical protein KME43_26370 [Myxacorys chilensis ATA2-1-KO14]|nr:hypothetical protein [Myxacorys chilensis ATA2-1-KO14]